MDDVALADLSNAQLLSLRERIEAEHCQRLFENREEICSLFAETLVSLGFPCELTYSCDYDTVADRGYESAGIADADSPEFFYVGITLYATPSPFLYFSLIQPMEGNNISKLRKAVFASVLFAISHYDDDALLADSTARAEKLETLQKMARTTFPVAEFVTKDLGEYSYIFWATQNEKRGETLISYFLC